MLHVSCMLSRDDDVCASDRAPVVVNDRDLRFRIRPQPGHLTALANPGQLAAETMGKHDRRRHELGRLIAGVTEHQTLITGTMRGRCFAASLARANALAEVV